MEKEETTFDFDLERMKDRVENQKFYVVPDNLETLDDFKNWLKDPEGWDQSDKKMTEKITTNITQHLNRCFLLPIKNIASWCKGNIKGS